MIFWLIHRYIAKKNKKNAKITFNEYLKLTAGKQFFFRPHVSFDNVWYIYFGFFNFVQYAFWWRFSK